MSTRTFTVEEARALLPVLESLLRRAMEAKDLVQEIEHETQALKTRIAAVGGCLVNVREVAKRNAQGEKAVQRVKDCLAEINAIGVQVKDLDIGLLDFPCMVGDRTILLCWKLGEETVSHWHAVEEGFRGRKPIDTTILNAKKQKG